MKALIGLVIGIAISLGLAAFVGESPFHVLSVLVKSGVGSADDLANSLFYATSLMFTGLACAISFRAGLFNIGAEGQLNFGSLFSGILVLSLFGAAGSEDMAAVGLGAGVLHFLLVMGLSFSGGAIWGGIVGALKAYRGAHEVVLTMMMNFIAVGIMSYFIVGVFQSASSQNPETEVFSGGFRFTSWDPLHAMFPDTPFNSSFLLAVLLCLFFAWFFKKTKAGFIIRVLGENPKVAEASRVNVPLTIFGVLALSGGIAGLVALNDVFGAAGKLRFGFSPDYGFIGVAVALLARNHPLGVIPSAFLFGVLQKGAADLDLETDYVNRDFAKVIQAIIILSVIASSALPSLWPRLQKLVKRSGDTSKA